MVVMNLPRDERFKPENLLVVGIIQEPKEPKHHINSFLQPLVDIDFMGWSYFSLWKWESGDV